MCIRHNRGYNMIQWTVTLSLAVAAFAFVSSVFKRTLYDKSYQVTDYLLWNKTPQDVMDNSSYFTRTKSNEVRDTALRYRNGTINGTLNTAEKSDMFSVSTEDGSQLLFKDFKP